MDCMNPSDHLILSILLILSNSFLIVDSRYSCAAMFAACADMKRHGHGWSTVVA